LPSGYPAGSFGTTAAAPPCGATGTPTYALADLTGDGRPDLIVTHVCGDGAVGDTTWRLHAAGGSGFADAPTAFALPSGYAAGSFAQISAAPPCGPSGTPTYALADIDGDRRPDLIVTHVCGDAATGDTQWIVHPAGDAGFGGARTWQLPTGYAAGSFGLVSGAPPCGPNGTPTYALTDLDGDHRPDLVVTHVCGDGAIGDTRWALHRGQDGGFAAAAAYALPTGYPTGSFGLISAAPACGASGTPTYALADVGGDGVADLVVTSACGNGALGTSHWDVHAGGTGGFAATADPISLPAGYPAGSFGRLAAAPACGPNGTPTYALTDIDGDHRPDLVVTHVCGDAATGDTRWLVHTNTCAP
jgi:hypothetical protein